MIVGSTNCGFFAAPNQTLTVRSKVGFPGNLSRSDCGHRQPVLGLRRVPEPWLTFLLNSGSGKLQMRFVSRQVAARSHFHICQSTVNAVVPVGRMFLVMRRPFTSAICQEAVVRQNIGSRLGLRVVYFRLMLTSNTLI
jgi:hypothetical protein